MLNKLLNKIVTFVIIYVPGDCVTPVESVKCLSKIFSCLLADGSLLFAHKKKRTRDVFYVRREADLMKTAKVNAYIMHIFGKIELLSIHAT